ncbi:MAG: AAA family ATPase [Salinisphaera sp.]|jgi:protein-tyrosine kinase|nr:AAA family ATPase [Salinisphaera sp.]
MSIVEKAAERLRRQSSNNSKDRAFEPVARDIESRQEQPGTVEKAVEKSRQTSPGLSVNGRAVTPDSAPKAQGGNMVLDRDRLRRAGLLPPEGLMPRIGREFQRIKRPLLAGIRGEDARPSPRANRVMVTSADPGDGKTFTSFNLAMSLANELDYSVLLVDGDVAKPGISRSLGMRDHIGLMDVLADPSIDIEEAIVASDLPHLSIMPAGGRREQPVERLSSRRMDDVMAELASDPTRIVVFDSPPLLATAESQALALNMGQIVMVVRAGRTERGALESALSLIDPETATISLILNQSRKGFGDNYDGYYGVYGAETD